MFSTKMIIGGIVAMTMAAGLAYGHGDVTPQAVDTTGLPALAGDWLKENPYRNDPALLPTAVKIGAVGYLHNCAACHGLNAISGGVAPDLLLLEQGKFGDEWFLERTRNGHVQNGMVKMPKYEGIVSQEAMWAIRSYIEAQIK
jgi:cytochrome c-550 PedF